MSNLTFACKKLKIINQIYFLSNKKIKLLVKFKLVKKSNYWPKWILAYNYLYLKFILTSEKVIFYCRDNNKLIIILYFNFIYRAPIKLEPQTRHRPMAWAGHGRWSQGDKRDCERRWDFMTIQSWSWTLWHRLIAYYIPSRCYPIKKKRGPKFISMIKKNLYDNFRCLSI